MKYSPKISIADFQRARYEKRSNKSPKVRDRMEMIYLKHKGYKHKEIADIIGVTPKTITMWMKKYMSEGIEGLISLKYKGQSSVLHKFRSEIKDTIEKKTEKHKGNSRVDKRGNRST